MITIGNWSFYSDSPELIGRFSVLQDKILQSMGRMESLQVTNDGATILRSIGVDNPAAKVLVGKHGNRTSDGVH